MKTRLLLLATFLILLIGVSESFAQVIIDGEENPINTSQHPVLTQPKGFNYITKSQYKAITYNGHTIDQLNSVADDEELLYDIFGQATSREVSTFGYVSYTFNGLTLGYKTEDPVDYISGFTATADILTVSVLGKVIRVGNTFEELKQRFGDDLKVEYKPELDPHYFIAFDFQGNDYDGLIIDLNFYTHKVVKITYFVNP